MDQGPHNYSSSTTLEGQVPGHSPRVALQTVQERPPPPSFQKTRTLAILPFPHPSVGGGGGGGDERVELRRDGAQAHQRHPLLRWQLHRPQPAQPHRRVRNLFPLPPPSRPPNLGFCCVTPTPASPSGSGSFQGYNAARSFFLCHLHALRLNHCGMTHYLTGPCFLSFVKTHCLSSLSICSSTQIPCLLALCIFIPLLTLRMCCKSSRKCTRIEIHLLTPQGLQVGGS